MVPARVEGEDVVAVTLLQRLVPDQLGRLLVEEVDLKSLQILIPKSFDQWSVHNGSVWSDCAIYCTLGNFSKPVATIILTTILGNFCKVVEIFHFSSEIIFGQTFIDIWQLFTGHTVFGWTRPDSTASLHTNNHIFSYLIKSSLVKVETSHTVIQCWVFPGMLLKTFIIYFCVLGTRDY